MSGKIIDPIVKKMESLPSLHPKELEEIRILANRPELTSDEAQELIHEISLWNAYLDFEKNGHGELR